MNKIVLLVLCFVSMAGVSGAYESAAHRFSIDFPDGWEIEEVKSAGRQMAQATHSSGAFLAVGADNQLKNYGLLGSRLSLDDFAQHLSTNLLYPMASSMCTEVKPVARPEARIESGRKTVQFVTYCDEAILTFRVVFYGSKGYMSMGYGDFNDSATFKELTVSMNSFYVY